MRNQLRLLAGVTAVAAGLGAAPAYTQDPARPPTTPSARTDAAIAERLSTADEAFIRKALAGGKAEVEMATLALQKASHDAVKQLAQRIESDHKKANEELMAIATNKNVNVDPKPAAEHHKAKARLGTMSGTQFDRAYLEMMVTDHQTAIQDFERQASGGTDSALKAFAAKTLPDLKAHLKMTMDAQKTLTSTDQR